MTYESKYAVGDVVSYKKHKSTEPDECYFGEINFVVFDFDNKCGYYIRNGRFDSLRDMQAVQEEFIIKKLEAVG